jgi:hypothetical protein
MTVAHRGVRSAARPPESALLKLTREQLVQVERELVKGAEANGIRMTCERCGFEDESEVSLLPSVQADQTRLHPVGAQGLANLCSDTIDDVAEITEAVSTAAWMGFVDTLIESIDAFRQ